MRKTETGLGIAAGASGIVLGVLSLLFILPYQSDTLIAHNAQTIGPLSIALIIANAVGIVGALLVRKHHNLGSVIMTVVTIAVLVLGFPWQTLPAVLYIMAVVMALVPVKVIR